MPSKAVRCGFCPTLFAQRYVPRCAPHTHPSQGPRSLAEQQDVEFDVKTDHRGRERAVNVTAVGGGPPHPFDLGSYYND